MSEDFPKKPTRTRRKTNYKNAENKRYQVFYLRQLNKET